MSDRFLDRVLDFMGIQDEEDEQDLPSETDAETETPGRTRRGRLVSFPAKSGAQPEPGTGAPVSAVPTSKWRMAVLEPHSFDDVQVICDHLKQRRPVIVSVEALDKELSRRVIDFVSGTTYAIDGQVQRVGDGIFVFAPSNVVIEAFIRRQWEEDES
ncbi:MAG: cell division protein SepF [Limnochordia bacterium]|jgi:cell division inhibitor SepF